MNEQLLRDLEHGRLTLFLGAGASYGCTKRGSRDENVPMGESLAKILAVESGHTYHGEDLSEVYEAAREILGQRLDGILEREFKHVTPSTEYELMARYVWRRIYTLNIDDGLELALARNSPQHVNRVSASDPVIEKDPFFEKLELIQLNGSVHRLHSGVIFSPSEYAKATASHLPWYSQCASDFVRTPVLFIGTKLNEPLLKYHIERYQTLNREPQGRSFLIARSATDIQIAALKRYQIEFIPGTLEDFVSWLKSKIPIPAKPDEIAKENIPQLKALLTAASPSSFASAFESVTAVTREGLRLHGNLNSNAIREFYKGFKPTWQDIADGIPARLAALETTLSRIRAVVPNGDRRLLPIVGPAGAGKTTLLMQTAWELGASEEWDVFYIHAQPQSLLDTLLAIERTAPAPKVLVLLDNIEFSVDDLLYALKSGRLSKMVLVGAARESGWAKRGKHVLGEFCVSPNFVRNFSEEDAERILEKLEHYGSWTRLGKMRPKERIRELVTRSRKQLLIALMEATLGRGFEQIIEEEYAEIHEYEDRLFLAIVAVISDRRCDAPVALVDRALEKIGVLRGSRSFSANMAGIIHDDGGKLHARHPVYAKYLVERVIDPSISAIAINGLLQAFADYKAPVIQNIDADKAILYKSLINHGFLFDVLKGNETRVTQIYKGLEKKFESDGLFWLQYGLSLRDFRDDGGALEKLRIARAAYPMPHTLHALAQQLLMSAMHSDIASIALGLAEEAKDILETLDDIIESDDTYPVVTLAEGYTEVLRKHVSEDEARSTARRYAIVLGDRARRNPEHERLQRSFERMFKFASTGTWVDRS